MSLNLVHPRILDHMVCSFPLPPRSRSLTDFRFGRGAGWQCSEWFAVTLGAMLSRCRCFTRTLGRSFSALSQGNNVLRRRSVSGLTSVQHVAYTNSSMKCDTRSTVFHIRFLKTSAAYRNEVITVNTPAFAESVTEGDVRWEKAVGDTVAEDEVVCEIETDKTSVQVPSPAAGVIETLLVPDGGKVEGGTPLFKLRKGAAAPKAEVPMAAASAPPPPPPAPSAVGPIPVSMPPVPPVPGQAIDAKPDLHDLSFPNWQRTFLFGAYVYALLLPQVKMNRMRLRIAQRLKEAQNTCAMLTTFNEVDMSNIQEMRKVHKDAFLKKHGIKLGFMSAFVKAAAHALADQPAVNAVIDDTTKEIVYRDYVDISVAVATPKGLVVPVIRGVEGMNFADIERTINELGEKVTRFQTHPPLPPLQVEIRPMMYVALTYDHRLIDGREAVTFLRKIKAVVEDPRVLLLDM
ncbi:dihydrolipoyllysine-residue succinyltransferase component of 2-oxoglutarate dehydrogenase complex, mitochondrial [Arapaima gigas]